MIYDQMEFYNVVEMESSPLYPGLTMHRFPLAVRSSISANPANLSRSCEIRFFLDDEKKQSGAVYLLARDMEGEAVVFYGDYESPHPVKLPIGVITPVPIQMPAEIAQLPQGRYPNRLCRVFLNNRSHINYIGREYFSCRPPEADEVPKKVLVGHGSSITHGGVARANCQCYLQLTGRMLGMDVKNLGVSGGCLVNKEMADYLATQVEGDVFFLELGINVLGRYTPEEFEEKVFYTLETVAKGHPRQPVFVTGLYPFRNADEKYQAFQASVKKAALELKLPNLHYLDPWKLLPDFTGLSTDGCHPTDYGHMLIARNLADAIRAEAEKEG